MGTHRSDYETTGIEKGIPIDPGKGRSRGNTLPFAKMEIGDSFFVEGITSAKLYALGYNFRKKNARDWGFSTRTENNGARIWRIEAPVK